MSLGLQRTAVPGGTVMSSARPRVVGSEPRSPASTHRSRRSPRCWQMSLTAATPRCPLGTSAKGPLEEQQPVSGGVGAGLGRCPPAPTPWLWVLIEVRRWERAADGGGSPRGQRRGPSCIPFLWAGSSQRQRQTGPGYPQGDPSRVRHHQAGLPGVLGPSHLGLTVPPPPPAWQQSDPLASQVPRPSSGDSDTGVTLDVPVGLSTCHVSLGAARRGSRTPHSLRSPQGGNEQDG